MNKETKQQPDQLATVMQEMKEKTWVKNARHRAQRRKSAWNLLMPLFGVPLWGAILGFLIWLAVLLQLAIHPHSLPISGHGLQRLSETFALVVARFHGNTPINLGGALVLLPSLFAAITPAMLITNFLVYRIPPARRAMDQEDRDFPETAYEPSQRALRKVAIVVFAVCLPLIVIGAVIQ